MKRPVVIGIILLVLIVAGGIIYKVSTDKGGALQSLGIGSQNTVAYGAKPAAISVTGINGYNLEKITLNGEQVPLIRIPLVTWGGYAALFAANKGIKPNAESLFYKKAKFAVELIREEDPAKHLAGYAAGQYPVIWSTMDSMPLLYDALKVDKRVLPQVFGVFDWSFGGDGIIVRENIKTPKDLKGKKVVTSGNSPSNFFLLWLISQSGLQPSDVNIQYVSDAIAAKDAFANDRSMDACVTWSPFLYEITDSASKSYVPNTRLLITSRDANQLIADVYLARLDFAKEHPEMIRAFSECMFEGADLFKSNPEPVYAAIAELFSLPGGAAEAKAAVGDTHIANFPENVMFFNLENSINAYKIFFMAQEYYKTIQSLGSDVSYEAERVVNTTYLTEFAKKGLFANQVNAIANSFNKQAGFDIADLESQKVVLTEDIQIHFDAQKIDFDFNGSKQDIVKNKQELEKIAEQMNVLGTTVVKLVGHLDTSKVAEFKEKGQQAFIEASAQAKLISKKRAEYIKTLLVEKYKCDDQRIVTEGKGWDKPLDPIDDSKNRRVEVKFLSFE